MKYFVEVGDQVLEVEVKPRGSRLTVELEGKTYSVDSATIEPSRRFSLIIDGRSVDVAVEPRRDDLQLIVRGRDHEVIVEGERERMARQVAAAGGPKGEVPVVSQMPGVVRKVFVKDGDHVASGDPLLILEAMKMENEIRAEVAGEVKGVQVTEEGTVDGGVTLLTIKTPTSDQG